MPTYIFKLLGGTGERSEIDLDVDYGTTIMKVKEMVRTALKIAPLIELELMAGGKKLKDDSTFPPMNVRPLKDTILVIGTRKN